MPRPDPKKVAANKEAKAKIKASMDAAAARVQRLKAVVFSIEADVIVEALAACDPNEVVEAVEQGAFRTRGRHRQRLGSI